jgi:hypothetical protein
MIAHETIRELQNTSVAERIHLMEILLNSLKFDIKSKVRQVRSRSKSKKFTVRTFNLEQDVHADRDIIYAERGF